MDAATMAFVPGTQLNLSLSFGFHNADTYCIAPIVTPPIEDGSGANTSSANGSSANSSDSAVTTHKDETPNYDFWAVGLNCCSGHSADFTCGEFSNPNARSGLRMMRDDLRNYFR